MDFEKVKNHIFDQMKRELPQDLFYHTIEHSHDVLQAAERIATMEGINEHDIILLKTAAVLHDSGFLIQYDANEPIGCDIARPLLHINGYECADILTVCNMIMATAIPQNPKNKLDEILCDADLDYLGRDDFYLISDKLRKELKAYGRDFSDQEWLKVEIDFLEKHKYFTETSQKLRDPQKQKYIRELKKRSH